MAEQWREEYSEESLGEPTRQMATALGYHLQVAAGALQTIAAQARGGDLQPSFAQQRLWILDQLEGAGAAYTMPGALHLQGALDRIALQGSFIKIAERHETLRSRFVAVDGLPVVRFAEEQPALEEVDLGHLRAEEREVRLRELVCADAARPFDLEKGPLLRATLVACGEESHVLLVNIHHIVSDGWSMGILMREWSALYNALASKEPSPLPPLPIQYADYAHWQREYLRGTELRRQLDYWRTALSGAPDRLELPTDFPRPAVQQYRGGTLDFQLPVYLVDGLRAIGDRAGASLFMVLLSAFAALLARYSGQNELVIGSPVANRSRREVENLIGFFVNTIALRLAVEPGASFYELLAQVRGVALGAYAHQEVSFEQLVEEVKPERNLSHAPIFQVLFSLQSTPPSQPEFDGLGVSSLEGENAISKYDLTLMFDERDAALMGAFEYNSDLFARETVARMATHLRTLLEAVVADPERMVARVPLLSGAERRQFTEEWNATAHALPAEPTIHGWIAAHAARTPAAIAVECEGW